MPTSQRQLQAHNGSLFPAAVVTFYCTYLCYSSMISEPHDFVCNGLGNRLDAASASTLAVRTDSRMPYARGVLMLTRRSVLHAESSVKSTSFELSPPHHRIASCCY